MRVGEPEPRTLSAKLSRGFLTDLDGYYANRGQEAPAHPSWGLFATALIAATGYE
jgi:hypothetical protein